jgi:hypothetical protein
MFGLVLLPHTAGSLLVACSLVFGMLGARLACAGSLIFMYLGPGGPARHVALDKGLTLHGVLLFIDQRYTLCLLCIMNALG